ncbi:MAG: response regulator transcription factor [Treponema sp.]|nr:response regulator transcription factor [Treponema sp.]
MSQLLPAAFSVMTLSLTFVIQNVLFLSTASLVYLYECIAAVELYSAMCLLYFSLRFREARSGKAVRMLFVKVFAPSILYSLAVLCGFDFNALSMTASAASFVLILASLLLIAHTLIVNKEPEQASPAAPLSLLSKREQEVVAHLLQGKSTQEAADALFVSPATVKTHIQHIYEKTGVHNRAGLVRFVQLFSGMPSNPNG